MNRVCSRLLFQCIRRGQRCISSVASLAPFTLDSTQVRLASSLDQLAINLEGKDSKKNVKVTGLYIFGSVGTGKSALMDLFHDSVPVKRKARKHFHDFMLEVHERIHRFKQEHPLSDPLPPVAKDLARDYELLCFDEFQVTDIADAMILKRLFELLFAHDVTLVATSNRPPDTLYENGINRALFLPFIDVLKAHTHVFEMDTSRDYRQDHLPTMWNGTTRYVLTDPTKPEVSQKRMYDLLRETSSNSNIDVMTNENLPVRMGRSITVPHSTSNGCLFTFDELCRTATGAADYQALCTRYNNVFVSDVPQLTSKTLNEARRFITFIDTMYESKTRLIMSSSVELKSLLMHFEVEIKETRDRDHDVDWKLDVLNGGGSSSSRHTTMLNDMEWSATGRVGVSLAEYSGATDINFAIKRTASRLVEMQSPTFGR